MRVLVVVDVQKEFNKFIQHDLVDELYDYARKFKQVYQIWDTHKTDIAPTYVFPNQVDSVKKKYGKNHFSDNVTKFIKNKTDETFEGNLFKLSNGEGYIVRVDNNHDWFYVNPEMVELIQKLKNDQIILVGGADNECLEDVYQSFKSFGLNVHINKKYVYSAKTTQEDSINDKVLEKINISSELSREKIISNIKKYDGDYLLIRIDSIRQQMMLLDMLDTINKKYHNPIFHITGAYRDNIVIFEYWIIPIKEDLPFKFLSVYNSPYNYVNSSDFIPLVKSDRLIMTDMNYPNKVEVVLCQLIGTILDANILYSPKSKIK